MHSFSNAAFSASLFAASLARTISNLDWSNRSRRAFLRSTSSSVNAFAIVSGRNVHVDCFSSTAFLSISSSECLLVLVVISFPKTRGLCRRLLLLFTGCTSENAHFFSSSNTSLSPRSFGFRYTVAFEFIQRCCFGLLRSSRRFPYLSCRNNAKLAPRDCKFIASTSNKTSSLSSSSSSPSLLLFCSPRRHQ